MEILVLVGVLLVAVLMLLSSTRAPKFFSPGVKKFFLSGVKIYSRDLAVALPVTIRDIDERIAKLATPRLAHKVVSASQLLIQRQPTYVFITGVHGLISVSRGVRFEAVLAWPGVLGYVLVLAFFATQVDFSVLKMILPTLIVILVPYSDVPVMAHAVSKLEESVE